MTPAKPEAMCMRMPCSALLGFIVTVSLQVRAHLVMVKAVLPGLVRGLLASERWGKMDCLLWLWLWLRL